jgi:hypothetical protein
MIQGISLSRWRTSPWQRALGGLVTLIFATPVPVFATLSYGTFTLTNPGGGAPDWTILKQNFNSNEDSWNMPTSVVGGTASPGGSNYVFTGTVTVIGDSSNVTATLGGGGGGGSGNGGGSGGMHPFSNLSITNNGSHGTGLTISLQVGTVSFSSNQFTTAFEPPTSYSLGIGSFAGSSAGITYPVTLTLSFDSNAVWTVPSSATTIRVGIAPGPS